MKDKDLPNDYESSSLEELTLEANKIIEDLESQKDLQNSIEKYQNLIKLNKPDIMVIGSDWKNKKVIGEQYTKKLVFFDRVGEYSTTKIINNYDS